MDRQIGMMASLTWAMKVICFLIVVGLGLGSVMGESRGERLLGFRDRAAVAVALYWLPETREVMRENIPGQDQWVGFEGGMWAKLTDEEREKVLMEVGKVLDGMEGKDFERTWERIRIWDSVARQLGLCSRFYGESEDFLLMAYGDPLLRPAFQWILDRRGAKFHARYVGGTLATGEAASFYPHLVLHLLDAPEEERLACFSRLLARASRSKAGESGVNSLDGVFEGEGLTVVIRELGSGEEWVFNEDRSWERFVSYSTFKIPNSIIGLETGAVKGLDEVFVYDEEKHRSKWRKSEAYHRDQTLETAFRVSVVWTYQEIAERVGRKAYEDYLEKWIYGNRDVSGGLREFWLNSLAVSAQEQVAFLERFVDGELGLKEETVEAMREIMLLEEGEGYRLFAKTGTGPVGENWVGWLVGFVEAGGEEYVFALNVEAGGFGALKGKRMEILRKAFGEVGVNLGGELDFRPKVELPEVYMTKQMKWAAEAKTKQERADRLEAIWWEHLPRENGGKNPRGRNGYEDGTHGMTMVVCGWALADAYMASGQTAKARDVLRWLSVNDARLDLDPFGVKRKRE